MGSIAYHIRGFDFKSFRIIEFSDHHENMDNNNIKKLIIGYIGYVMRMIQK